MAEPEGGEVEWSIEKLVAEKELDVIVIEVLLVFESIFNTHLESFYCQDSEEMRLLLDLAATGNVEGLVRAYELQYSLENEEIKRDQLSQDELNLVNGVAQVSSRINMSGFALGTLLAARSVPTRPQLTFMSQHVFKAAKGPGLKVFEGVLLAVHDQSEKEKYRVQLHKNLEDTMTAFSVLFRERVRRNVQVPAFAFFGSKERTVKWVLEHVKEVQEKFPSLQVLIEGSIPYLEYSIRSSSSLAAPKQEG